MRGRWGGGVLGACVPQFPSIHAIKERLSSPQKCWRDGKVNFVQKSRLHILADCCRPTANPDVSPIGRRHGPLQRRFDSFRDEVKGGAALHGDGRSRVMGQDKDRRVVWRVIAPPAPPTVVRPGTSTCGEHIAAQDPGANILKPSSRELVIDTRAATFAAEHVLYGPGCECPLMQLDPTHAKRIFKALIGSGAVTIQ